MEASDRARPEAAREAWRTAPSVEDAVAAAEAAVVRWAWFTDSLGCSPAPSEDFFVYAVDLELEELDANLRAALGSARYRELVKSALRRHNGGSSPRD